MNEDLYKALNQLRTVLEYNKSTQEAYSEQITIAKRATARAEELYVELKTLEVKYDEAQRNLITILQNLGQLIF